jgi:hypothetical protein
MTDNARRNEYCGAKARRPAASADGAATVPAGCGLAERLADVIAAHDGGCRVSID